MAETILQILQWAIPSGGIGAAIAWIANRKAASAKTAKAVHDTYKTMYEDISQLLVENQKKNEKQSIRCKKSLTKRAQKAHVSSGRSTVFLGLLRLFNIVLIVLTVLLAVSCRSTKKLIQVSHSERSTELLDSEVVNISTLQMQPVKVPMSAVSLTLNLDTLRLLPLGASYTARQGQASLK